MGLSPPWGIIPPGRGALVVRAGSGYFHAEQITDCSTLLDSRMQNLTHQSTQLNLYLLTVCHCAIPMFIWIKQFYVNCLCVCTEPKPDRKYFHCCWRRTHSTQLFTYLFTYLTANMSADIMYLWYITNRDAPIINRFADNQYRLSLLVSADCRLHNWLSISFYFYYQK